MAISVSQAIMGDIIAQLEAAYPAEACGVIIGEIRAGDAQSRYYLPLDNIRTDNRERRFLIDPLIYQEVEDRADEEGLAIISIVHSHPDHPDTPSEFDRQHAWPGLSYIIVSVVAGRQAGYSSWRLTDDRQRFVKEAIQT